MVEPVDIKVGSKPLMNYIFSIAKNPSVVIKARGENIKKAVNVALIAQRECEYTITSVEIYDSKFETEVGEKYISNIDITLKR